jgi:hypothetical protein
MKKDRFGRYLPIMTAVTAMALYHAISKPQAIADEAKSALSDAAEAATALLEDASAGTSADLLAPPSSSHRPS